MSTTIDDGGPAFPVPPVKIKRPGNDCPEYAGRQVGMSLRAWFAGQALAGYRSCLHPNTQAAPSEVAAKLAVMDADALIAALKKSST